MRFLKYVYVAMISFSFLHCGLGHAETVNVANAKNKVIEPKHALTVNYKLDENNIAVSCVNVHQHSYVPNQVVWHYYAYQGGSLSEIDLDRPFLLVANSATAKKLQGKNDIEIANATDNFTITNQDRFQSMGITCEYIRK